MLVGLSAFELMAQQLADRASWKAVEEDDHGRNLVRRELRATDLEEVRFLRAGVGFEHHERPATLVPSDHSGLEHSWMLLEHAFHVTGVHHPPVDDKAVDHPADDPHEAFVVDACGVPAAQPTLLVDCSSGRIGALPVPGHDVRSAHEQLARLVRRAVIAVGSDDANVDEQRRLPRRAHLADRALGVEQEGKRCRLGEAVALEERQSSLHERTNEMCRDWRAAGHEHSEAREVGRAPPRCPDERVEEIGVRETGRHPVPLDQVEQVVRIQRLGDDDRASLEERGKHVGADAARSEEGCHRDRDVLGTEVADREPVRDVPGDIGVREHHTLGRAGRAGCVREHAQVVERDRLVDRIAGRLGDQLLEVGPDAHASHVGRYRELLRRLRHHNHG